MTLETHKVYSGKEFNELAKGRRFVRLTNKEENHNGFQYKTGLNKDHLMFRPHGECEKGGLYFCDYNDFACFIKYNGTTCVNIRDVTIPDNAKVYVMNGKYKANKFILGEPTKIFTNEQLCIDMVKRNAFTLKYVKEQTPAICMEAVKSYFGSLIFVKNQTPDICLEAVKQYGTMLGVVKEQTPEICLEAVKQNGLALKYVANQTPEICLEAVKQNGHALRYVKDVTLEIYISAVKQAKRDLSDVLDNNESYNKRRKL